MPRLRRFVVPHHHHQQRPIERELPADHLTATGKLRRGLATPRSLFRLFILRLLLQAERYRMAATQVRRTIQSRLAGRFTAADLINLRDGLPRWVNALQWERKRMVMEGLLEPTSEVGHGVWQLTRQGVREAQN